MTAIILLGMFVAATTIMTVAWRAWVLTASPEAASFPALPMFAFGVLVLLLFAANGYFLRPLVGERVYIRLGVSIGMTLLASGAGVGANFILPIIEGKDAGFRFGMAMGNFAVPAICVGILLVIVFLALAKNS